MNMTNIHGIVCCSGGVFARESGVLVLWECIFRIEFCCIRGGNFLDMEDDGM